MSTVMYCWDSQLTGLIVISQAVCCAPCPGIVREAYIAMKIVKMLEEWNIVLPQVTMLDPRLKDNFFASNVIKTTMKEMLEEKYKKLPLVMIRHKKLDQDHAQKHARKTLCSQCTQK